MLIETNKLMQRFCEKVKKLQHKQLLGRYGYKYEVYILYIVNSTHLSRFLAVLTIIYLTKRINIGVP